MFFFERLNWCSKSCGHLVDLTEYVKGLVALRDEGEWDTAPKGAADWHKTCTRIVYPHERVCHREK